MAEYYPLLAKAVGRLPNSTAESRRVVYERARKALIGQLRTLHPPVPDEDIDRESVELDRAIERIETELAAAPVVARPAPPDALAKVAERPPAPSGTAATPAAPPSPSGTLGPAARKPIMPPRPRPPKPSSTPATVEDRGASFDAKPELTSGSPAGAVPRVAAAPGAGAAAFAETETRPRVEGQRPIAPQPRAPKGPKRRMWIIPVGLGVVVLLVAAAAWKLRDRPEVIARTTPATTQPQKESGKIADRVGGEKTPDSGGSDSGGSDSNGSDQTAPAPSAPSAPTPAPAAAQPQQAAASPQTAPQGAATASNPELPIAHRAALLVEAPDSPSKVQTFPGTVVWKLNNVSEGPSDAVGLSVEADIDLPDDKTKAVVVFEKNTDPSLPASHTIKVRFTVDPGSYSGDIKQISVPQMRREGNSDGEPLAGVTVPVIQNSFLVGLSPGNAETANLRLINDLPWMDIPILLNSGKIAKLTFEKGASGQRDIADALAFWQKQ